MTDSYSEHPTYGHENRDHKTVTVTFQTDLSKGQLDALFDGAPQLDDKFGMDYLDGGLDANRSFSHDWEKTDRTPRGVTGYEVTREGIKIWASEAIDKPLFLDTVRHVLSEASRCDGVGEVAVGNVASNGVDVSFSGGTLRQVADTIRVPEQAPRIKRPGPKP